VGVASRRGLCSAVVHAGPHGDPAGVLARLKSGGVTQWGYRSYALADHSNAHVYSEAIPFASSSAASDFLRSERNADRQRGKMRDPGNTGPASLRL
jgi:hypothetical protein